MLDAQRKLTIDGLPGVAVYADSRDPRRFYAFAARPRLETDREGRPQLSLLLYGRDQEHPRGGQVTLTTTLALSPDERDALVASLPLVPPAAPAASSPEPRARPAPRPQVVAPEWLAGAVTARLADGVECSGNPSLAGPNTCVLAATLDGSQAAALRRAMDHGLPDSKVEYRVEVSAARHARQAASATTKSPGSSTVLTVDVSGTVAERYVLKLSGPLRIPPVRSADLVTFVAL